MNNSDPDGFRRHMGSHLSCYLALRKSMYKLGVWVWVESVLAQLVRGENMISQSTSLLKGGRH